MDSGKRQVVIVGGGLSGLAAARSLARVCNVIVLEASNALGGRIKHITGLVPWPVEIGPEFLHGKQNSSVKAIADEIGCKFKELPYPDCYFLGSEGKFLRGKEADGDADIQTVHAIFSGLADEKAPAPDISMEEYLKAKGVRDTVRQLAESIYANDFGCSLAKLGVGECIEEARLWSYGDTYIILDRPLSCIIQHLARGLNVLLDHAVEEIIYSSHAGVELRCSRGKTLAADYVIVTVPVKVLQQEKISFTPPLPNEKIRAASAIGMSNALKIFLSFSIKFWPEDMFDVVCTGCFVPEFWTTEYPETQYPGSAAGKYLLVGFMAGDIAVSASMLSDEMILSRALSQLDGIFGRNQGKNAESKAVGESTVSWVKDGSFYRKMRHGDCSFANEPASFSFQAGCVVDWSKEEFIGGGYTHPSLNALGTRDTLAAPLLGRIFFAGEATHPGVNPCMQAAIDTGERAAQEVRRSIS